MSLDSTWHKMYSMIHYCSTPSHVSPYIVVGLALGLSNLKLGASFPKVNSYYLPPDLRQFLLSTSITQLTSSSLTWWAAVGNLRMSRREWTWSKRQRRSVLHSQWWGACRTVTQWWERWPQSDKRGRQRHAEQRHSDKRDDHSLIREEDKETKQAVWGN
jgi:hypothetical protein